MRVLSLILVGLALVAGCAVSPTATPEPTNDRGETLEQEFARIDGDPAEAAEFGSLLDQMMACSVDAPTRPEEAFTFYEACERGGRQGTLIEAARGSGPR